MTDAVCSCRPKVRQAPGMKSKKKAYSVVKDEGLHLGRDTLEFLHNHIGAILSDTKVIESKIMATHSRDWHVQRSP